MLTSDTTTTIPRDKASVVRGTTEARYFKDKAKAARRREDGDAIAESLDLHGDDDYDVFGAPATDLWSYDPWQDATFDFDYEDDVCAEHPNGDCWDDDQGFWFDLKYDDDYPTEELFGHYDTLASDLTVTQMFYGDNTKDEDDLSMWMLGASAL